MHADGGYTKHYRRLWDNPVFRSKQEAAVLAWMISAASWQPSIVRTRFGPVTLGVGEVLASERQLANDFGLHRNSLRSLLHRMVNSRILDQVEDQLGRPVGTIFRILKYSEYQGVTPMSNGHAGPDKDHRPGPGPGPPQDQVRTSYIDKGIEEGKEEEEESPQQREETQTAPPAPRAAVAAGYAFAGKVIRLSVRDHAEWKRRYHGIPDIDAELEVLDAYYDRELTAAEKRGWFNRCSRALGNKHQQFISADIRERAGNAKRSPGYALMAGFYEAGQEWDRRDGDSGAGSQVVVPLLDRRRHS